MATARKKRAERLIYGFEAGNLEHLAGLLNAHGFAQVIAGLEEYARQYRDDPYLPPPEEERKAVERMLAALAEARTHANIVEDLFASDVDSKH
jgi:hypothetical protein